MKVMKILISLLALLVFLPVSADITKPLSGDSYTEFGEYTIIPSDEPIMLGIHELETYDLKYENVDHVVKIAIDDRKRCKKFIVKHPCFEIQYECNKKGFGVCKIDKKYASLEEECVNRMLDEAQFDCQELLLSEPRPNDELLHTIAGFFPQLLVDNVRKVVKST